MDPGFGLRITPSVAETGVGELTVLAWRLGELLMGLGLGGLLSSNSFLLEDREKKRWRQKRSRRLLVPLGYVCLHINAAA